MSASDAVGEREERKDLDGRMDPSQSSPRSSPVRLASDDLIL